MKILAVDTSSLAATIAISENEVILGEVTVNNPKTHSQKLMPMIEHLFGQLELKVKDIDLILVSTGPGSFTGIRIGMSTVKAMAQVHKIPIVAISSIKMLAYSNLILDGIVCPMIDAKKKDVFCGIYEFKDGKLINETKDSIVAIEELSNVLNESSKGLKVYPLGDGANKYRELLSEKLKEKVVYPPINLDLPKASSLIRTYFMEKEYLIEMDYNQVHANYLRKSQAEIDRDIKLSKIKK